MGKLEYPKAALWLWLRGNGRKHCPRRIFAAWNCLRGRPTMYRIKIYGGARLHDMSDLVVAESEFTDVDKCGVQFERVRRAFVASNLVRTNWTGVGSAAASE